MESRNAEPPLLAQEWLIGSGLTVAVWSDLLCRAMTTVAAVKSNMGDVQGWHEVEDRHVPSYVARHIIITRL